MSNNSEQDCFFDIENDKISDIIQEKKTDEEMSHSTLEIKRKTISIPIRVSSAVWQHFEKIFNDKGIHLQSKCNYCSQIYSAGCSTTTLNDHWKSKHSKVQPGGIGSIEMAFNNFKQQQVVKLQGEEHLNLLDKLINWIIVDCQPFSTVDNYSFKELINSLNPGFKVPSRQTLHNKIDNKYTNYKNNIIEIFQI